MYRSSNWRSSLGALGVEACRNSRLRVGHIADQPLQINLLVPCNIRSCLLRPDPAVGSPPFLFPGSHTNHLRFLPETLRALVGNGSVQPSAIYIPLVPFIGKGKRTVNSNLDKPRRPKFANPFLLFMHLDVTITLLFTGIVYAVNYTITASMASAFAATYPYLSETSLGLCYLSTGGGMLVGSTITGKVLDREYRVVKEGLRKNDVEVTNVDFPIEYARLRTMPIHLLVFCASVFAWGWCLEKNVSIVAPLVFQVLRKSVGRVR